MEEALANRLRDILRRSRIRQKDLARMTGLTESAISHYVNGVQCPRLSAFVLIADALNVSTDYLLGRKDMDGERDA